MLISEMLIGRVLRIGLWISVLTVLTGGMIYLVQFGHEPIQYQELHEQQVSSLLELGTLIKSLSAEGIIYLGLLFLVFTQLLRVGLTALLFFQEKDWFFTVVSLFILGVLIYSLFWRD